MSSKIKIALMQVNSKPFDKEENYKKAKKFIKEASKKGAKIICTPELFSIGYPKDIFEKEKNKKKRISKLIENSETIKGDFVNKFKKLAKENNIAIILGLSEKNGKKLFNTSVLISEKGKIIGKYSKVHVCRWQKFEGNYTDGEDFKVFNLKIGKNKLKIGIMICYDREHPESARILALKDADIIFVPNACNIDKKRIIQIQTRALENEIYLAMTNYSRPFNGNSAIIDYKGDILSKKNKEGLIFSEINIEKLKNYRKNNLWGKHYRRPKKYKKIVS